MVDITATYDKTTYLPKNTMTREGYVFYHWTATINGRIVTFEDEEGIRNLTTVDGQIITLTAVWTPKPHRVTFEGGAGTIGGIANPQDVKNGETPNVAGLTASYGNHVLIGWSFVMQDPEGGDPITGYTYTPGEVKIYGDTVFTAQWGGPRVVVYLPGDHGLFTPYIANETLYTDLPMGATAEQYPYGGAVDDEKHLPLGEEGWQFMGWDRVATDASGNIVGDRLIITLNEYLNDPVGSLGFIDNDEQTVTFIARWYKPFTLTYDLMGGGTWKEDFDFGFPRQDDTLPVKLTVGAGEIVTVPTKDAIDRAGWMFEGWATSLEDHEKHIVTYPGYDENGNVFTDFEMPEHDVTLYAVWTQREYRVHYATAAAPTSASTSSTGPTAASSPPRTRPGRLRLQQLVHRRQLHDAARRRAPGPAHLPRDAPVRLPHLRGDHRRHPVRLIRARICHHPLLRGRRRRHRHQPARREPVGLRRPAQGLHGRRRQGLRLHGLVRRQG